MFHRFTALSSPRHFYAIASAWLPWLSVLTALGFAVGLYWGLVVAPPDYQQGEAYRIIYVHVPSAWLSLMVYTVMAGAGLVALVWHVKLAEIAVYECAVLGAWFTALALGTGMLWGKPMWGTWWQWGDARMLSELILLFLYIGVLGLHNAFADSRKGARVAPCLPWPESSTSRSSITPWSGGIPCTTVTRFDKRRRTPLHDGVLLARIRAGRQWVEEVRRG